MGSLTPLAYLVFSGYPGQVIFWTVPLVVLCAWAGKWQWTQSARTALNHLADRRLPAGLVVGAASFLAVGFLSLHRGYPLPYVHDEFSYLLAADTFAHGRLTNPPSPIWEHFESMHILVRPTYMSKYPPGQGLFMALGQVTIGHPIWGIWLSTALACMAIWWMLLAFVPPRWAFLGGLLAAMHPQILEWGQRYWSGNVAVLGGALFIGGWARIVRFRPRKSSAWHAVWMAAGIVVLANSRPYEGLVLVTAALLAMAWIWFRRHGGIRMHMGRVVLPAACILVPAGLWMGYYNWRITGNPLRLPYMEHQTQYGVVPLFIFQDEAPKPVYHNKELEYFQVHEQEYWYVRHNSLYELQKEAMKDLERLEQGALGNVEVLALALVILPWIVWKDRRTRSLVGILAVFLAGLLVETYMFAHYAAPAAGAVAVLVVLGLRWISRTGGRLGMLLVRVTVAVALLWSAFWWRGFYQWKQEGFAVNRHDVQRIIQAKPGKHVILVRYTDEHNVHEEWVYNPADIDNAKVIWARSMGQAKDQELINYFRDRTPWLIEPDKPGLKVVEIPRSRPPNATRPHVTSTRKIIVGKP